MEVFSFFVEKELKSDIAEHTRMVQFIACILDMFDHCFIDLLCGIQSPKAYILRIVFSKTAQNGHDTISLNPAENAQSDAIIEHALNISLFLFEKRDELITVHKRIVRQVNLLHENGLYNPGYLLHIFLLDNCFLFGLFYDLQGFCLEQGQSAAEGGIR